MKMKATHRYQQITETAEFLRGLLPEIPEVPLFWDPVWGLWPIVSKIRSYPYHEIPGFVATPLRVMKGAWSTGNWAEKCGSHARALPLL
jgi:hypothetical protein